MVSLVPHTYHTKDKLLTNIQLAWRLELLQMVNGNQFPTSHGLSMQFMTTSGCRFLFLPPAFAHFISLYISAH